MKAIVRTLIALVVTLNCVAIAGAQGLPAKENDSWDLIIRNGRVIDGSGNPWFSADIGVRGDRIVFIGDLREARARRGIDAGGVGVASGVIDMPRPAGVSLLCGHPALRTRPPRTTP